MRTLGMGAAEGPDKPITLFYSYSHRDEELRKKLEDHLAALRWSGMIAEWHDRNIDVGDEWAKEIDRNLSSADIILLLVSASFIASAYCWSVEVKKALERHEKGEAKVIPIILRRCSWHTTPFAKLQAAPTDAKPVTRWSDQDEALHDVVCKIERAVTDLQQQRRRAVEQAQQRAEEARKRQAAEEDQREALQRQREQEEARKQAAAEARQVAEQQQREAQQRREQDEARRAAEAEAARVPRVSHDDERHEQPREQARLEALAAARFADFFHDIDFAVFRDIDEPWCPEMVALPAGEFLMGSSESDKESCEFERPQHRVAIGYRFALGRFSVTCEEYDHFERDIFGRQVRPRQAATGVKLLRAGPMMCDVSWWDAHAYVEWLAKATGKPYRLPSEAEWEYAYRAGKTTPGNMLLSWQPNNLGLYYMEGLMQWVEDVWHDSYNGAPTDGSAWTDRGGQYRVVRGYIPLRPSPWDPSRSGQDASDHYGFRVARTLD